MSTPSYLKSPITTRNDFGKLLTSLGLVHHAAEIGVHLGEFSRQLLDTWPGCLSCIDPWCDLPGYEEEAKTLSGIGGTGDRDQDYKLCQENLKPYKNRVLLIRSTSREAVRQYDDETLDFVYIDGHHAMIAQDLERWYPKVKPGGALAGHDFDCNGDPEFPWRHIVKPAVIEFAINNNLDIYLVVEEVIPWSWYIFKQ